MNAIHTIRFRRACCLQRAALAVLAFVVLLLPSCEWDGQFTVLGYTTRPNYDPSIHTVYVPIFKNLTYRRGLEFDLTRAVVREIQEKTPFKVVSDRSCADTELTGTVVSLNKLLLNRNQENEVREAETTFGVEVVWKDLRPGHEGEYLTAPRRTGAMPLPAIEPASVPGMPQMAGLSAPTAPLGMDMPVPLGAPPPPGATPDAGLAPPPNAPPPPKPPPVLVQSIAGFIPELGESMATATQRNVNRLAVQIVSMMEKPW